MVTESNNKSNSNLIKVKPSSNQSQSQGHGSSSSSYSKGRVILPLNNNNNNNNNNNKKITTTNSSSSKHQSLDSSKHNKSVTTTIKSEVRDKTSSSSSRTVVTKTTTVRAKSQKKVYTLAGQKYDPPEEREPLRIFYESLSKQIPSSEMAAFWMMEHGLLSPERAKRAYERKQKRQQQLRMGTPVKSLPKLNRPESSQKQQISKNGDMKGKRKIMKGSDDDEDDDFIMKCKKGKG